MSDNDIGYQDVRVPIARVQGHHVYTLSNGDETLQVLVLTFPDGSSSPLLAFTQKGWSDLLADGAKRDHAALEDALGEL